MPSLYNPPWLVCAKPGEATVISDQDGRVMCVVGTALPGLEELLALAPEAMRELATLVHAVCSLDPTYCAQNGIAPDANLLAEALSDAIALINHARDVGVSVPEVMQ